MSLDEQLIDAVKNNEIEEVRSLLEGGADVNAKDQFGKTLLHFACECGHKEIAEILIQEYKASVHASSNTGTPLHFAAARGHINVITLLLEYKADVNAEVDGYTPLYWTIKKGKTEAAELLLKNGADVNAKNKNGNTSLDIGFREKNGKAIFLLQLYGADTTIKKCVSITIDDIYKLSDCLVAFKQIKAMPHLGRLIEANIKKEGAKAIASYINNEVEGQELSEEFKTIKEKYGSDEQLSFVSEYLSDFVEHMILNYMINHKETNAIRDMAHLAKNPIKNKIDVPEEMFENIASYLDNQSLKNLHLAYHMSTDEDYGRAMNLLKRMKATESVLDQPGAVGLENLFRER